MTPTLDPTAVDVVVKTPTSANGLNRMRGMLDKILDTLNNDDHKAHVQKVMNAAERSFANCALLADENHSLIAQNNEKKVRQAARATIPGPAKIMSYEDIVRAQKAREENEAKSRTNKRKRGKRKDEESEACDLRGTTEAMSIGESLEQRDNLVQAVEERYVEGLLAPCPGRAPVAKMW